MATELRNVNQRTAVADNLDKQDPRSASKALNSKPKGKDKLKNSRLREHQEREELLQKHRTQQLENLKRRRERERQYTNQRDQEEKQANTPPITHPAATLPLHEIHPAGHDIMAPSEDLKLSAEDLDRGPPRGGALGDSNLHNTRSKRRRCTNCCGRPQVSDPRTSRVKGCSGIGEYSDNCILEQINDSCEETESEITFSDSELRLKGGCAETVFRVTSSRKTENENEIGKQTPEDMIYEKALRSNPELASTSQQNLPEESETRLRGGCGGCGSAGGGGRSSACCPCGGCGGAACGTNSSYDNRMSVPSSGCCGGNQTRGLPCRCVCNGSRNPSPPCGSCGGQNCGKWNSCAGSTAGGKCCFPRNTKRHNGPGCCGGGSCC